jgi:hypothetical protein
MVNIKDRLYLLRSGFMKGDAGPFYCNDSAPVEGMLSFFPQLRELLDVQYVEFARPRTALVEELGAEHQSLPALVLAPGRTPNCGTPEPQSANGRRFYIDERKIREYLSIQHGLPQAS